MKTDKKRPEQARKVLIKTFKRKFKSVSQTHSKKSFLTIRNLNKKSRIITQKKEF